MPIIFGDATGRALEPAGIAAARLLVIATPDCFLARRAVEIARAPTPVDVVVRAHSRGAGRLGPAFGLAVMGERELARACWNTRCAASACPQSEHGCWSKTCPALNSRRERSDGSGYERFAGGGLIRASIRGHHVASLTADRMERVMGTTYAAGLNMRQQCPLPEIGRWSARGRSWPLADLVPVRYPAR